jgi:hypothetical protein
MEARTLAAYFRLIVPLSRQLIEFEELAEELDNLAARCRNESSQRRATKCLSSISM